MLSERLKQSVVQNIWELCSKGYRVVLVHGGGPFIRKMLELVEIESEFIEGHRKTTPEALRYIEMALKGEVNGSLVGLLNEAGMKAVGLSGKDGRMVLARKRYHYSTENGQEIQHDLGQVGDVEQVAATQLNILLENDYLPVVTCIASDDAGNDYNINADMFAGSLAGALQASHYLVLTDVDGLLRDIGDPSSLIRKLKLEELEPLFGSVIKGGMIPKLESCELALRQGARSARIINGTRPESILEAVNKDKSTGTEICL